MQSSSRLCTLQPRQTSHHGMAEVTGRLSRQNVAFSQACGTRMSSLPFTKGELLERFA